MRTVAYLAGTCALAFGILGCSPSSSTSTPSAPDAASSGAAKKSETATHSDGVTTRPSYKDPVSQPPNEFPLSVAAQEAKRLLETGSSQYIERFFHDHLKADSSDAGLYCEYVRFLICSRDPADPGFIPFPLSDRNETEWASIAATKAIAEAARLDPACKAYLADLILGCFAKRLDKAIETGRGCVGKGKQFADPKTRNDQNYPGVKLSMIKVCWKARELDAAASRRWAGRYRALMDRCVQAGQVPSAAVLGNLAADLEQNGKPSEDFRLATRAFLDALAHVKADDAKELLQEAANIYPECFYEKLRALEKGQESEALFQQLQLALQARGVAIPHSNDSALAKKNLPAQPDPNAIKEEERVATFVSKVTGDFQQLKSVTRDDKLPGNPVVAVCAGSSYRLQFNNDFLKQLAAFPRLRKLDLATCRAITDGGLGYLEQLSELEELNLSDCHRVTSAGLAALKRLRRLRVLRLDGTSVGDDGLAQLVGNRELATLTLNRTGVTDAGLRHLASLSRLERIELAGTAVCGEGFVHLRHLPRLSSVSLARTPTTDAGLHHVAALKGLKDVSLAWTQVTNAGLKYLGKVHGLSSLSLCYTEASDTGLAELSSLTHLTSLDLEGTQITDVGLKHVSVLHELTTLNLTFTAVSDAGLTHLAHLTSLAKLELARTAITGPGLKDLQGLTSLAMVALDFTAVSDAALATMPPSSTLSSLSLRGTDVTDAGLKHLSRLPKLTSLDVRQTNITDVGLTELTFMGTRSGTIQANRTRITSAGIARVKATSPQLCITGP